MVDTQDNHGTTTTAAAGAEEPADDRAQEVPEPSFRQLLRVGVTKGLPFVAFGFFDNIIMVGGGRLAGWVAGWVGGGWGCLSRGNLAVQTCCADYRVEQRSQQVLAPRRSQSPLFSSCCVLA
jgi:hypothetical protein